MATAKNKQAFEHYSFDLWRTLLRRNPEFQKAKVAYFKRWYNPDMTDGHIEATLDAIDKECTHINEITGKHISAEQMYAMYFYRTGVSKSIDAHGARLIDICESMHAIAMANPPMPYDINTLPMLKKLKDMGKTIFLSNTGFMKGDTIRKVLSLIGIHDLIDSYVFSDEVGASKPSTKAFQFMYEQAMFGRLHLNVDPDEQYIADKLSRNSIIHIGDSEDADINGARNFGVAFFQINSNKKTILDIPI